MIYPAFADSYSDLNKHQIETGKPFHNISDIVKQYKFENVEKVTLIVIGKSKKSNFDFGVQLTLFSTY
jgi:hypothetical protein